MDQYRHELKYMINEWDALILKQLLRPVLSHDENSGENGRYLVRSLYFDNIWESAFNDKINGVFQRKKYRIRTYGDSGKSPVKAECKLKKDAYICKFSATLENEEFYQILRHDYDFLLRKTSPLLQDYYIQCTSYGLRPRVIVDYDREAFILNEGNVRITFDHAVRASNNTFDILSHDLRAVPVFPPGELVLEVKYDDFLPNKVRGLLKLDSLQQIAVSKFVLCRMKNFV